MLDKFNAAAKHRPVAMLLLGVAVLVTGGVLGSFWWTVACAIVAWYSYGVLRRSRKTRVSYEMDEAAKQTFTTLQSALKVLSQTKRAWRVVAEQSHADWKRNAGTGGSVKRADAFVGQVKPPHVEANVAIYGLKATKFGMYFFPDALYVFDGARYGQIAYPDLRVDSSYQDIVEANSVPKDASIVRQTWQYVRRDGGPDRRFANNRQLPVARYGFLQFTSSAGLNVHVYISNEAVSIEFAKHLNGYLSWERNRVKATTEVPGRRLGRPRAAPKSNAGKAEGLVTDSLVAAHETLGLEPGATLEQVVSAYRSLVQKYHPDKVSHLGKEFQDMAAKRTGEINRAYALLREALA